MSEPKVVGLDLSLTRTGVAWGTSSHLETYSYGTDSKKFPGTIEGRSLRLRHMVTHFWPYLQHADLVVIESPAYSSNSGHAHDRSGLWWMIVGRLTGAGVTVVEVKSNTLKVYATGKGRAEKDEVLAAVVRRYPHIAVANNDEADALMLACMGCRATGQPYDPELPKTHTRAMAAPAWPQLRGAAQ